MHVAWAGAAMSAAEMSNVVSNAAASLVLAGVKYWLCECSSGCKCGAYGLVD